MQYEAVIFDLDGVICHTDAYHYQAWKVIADKLGVVFDEKINNRLRGISRMESLEIILEKYEGVLTTEEKEKYALEKNERYKLLLSTLSEENLNQEVKETLLKLKERGIRTAIGSSSRNAAYILNKLGIEEYFDVISDGNNISKSKPDPEVFLKASGYLNIPTEKCLVVEDALAGLRAAKAAGMDCAGISEAGKSEEATYSLQRFSDILYI